jgi:N-acetylmuramoyl-L-alanine amidase
MSLIQKPTPNFGPRPSGTRPSAIVLHADASTNETGTISWIAKAESKVSYHYLIGRDGRVYQFVADHLRAWHAGKSIFDGVHDCNDFTIGVSWSNDQKTEPFTGVSIDVGIALVAMLCGRHAIPLARITTHAVVRNAARQYAAQMGLPLPDVKSDPGPLFPTAKFFERLGAIL